MSFKVSAAEWEVLSTLWDRAPASASEVWNALSQHKSWHSKTVGTFLTRLVKKGLVTVDQQNKVNMYSPRHTRDECVRAESASFIQRVFRGSSGPLLLHFVEQADLTPAEIDELQEVLKRKRRTV